MKQQHGFKKWVLVLIALVALSATVADVAYAELQNVEVGGELRMRGRYYINTFGPGYRIPASAVDGRAMGYMNTFTHPPSTNGDLFGLFDWSSDGDNWSRYETSVLVNVKADFTDNVSAFIEFYDFHIWGEDFRSQDWESGYDDRATIQGSNAEVEVNQAYIEMREMFGMPLRLRIGRQALKLGKGWLITDMLTPSQYVSHDAIRLTYAENDVTIDAFMSKLSESVFGDVLDNDMNLYGIYGTYSGMEALSLSAYYFLLLDDRPLNLPGNLLGDYGSTDLNTIGIRAFGRSSGFDYDLELAYQFGDADRLGAAFAVPDGSGNLVGDEDAEFGEFAGEITVGYTFADVAWTPRVYVKGAYFGGEDNRESTYPNPEASISFNRLFSATNYMPVINDNGWMSNFSQVQLGVEAKPAPKISVHAHVAKEWANEGFTFPGTNYEGETDLGWEVAAYLRYTYSKDLWFLFYGNYLFVGDGLAEGVFSQTNGLGFTGGSDPDNADDAGYIFWMAVLKF